MISKVILSKSFYGACKYICENEKRAVILETEGVRDHNYKLMASDFEMQRLKTYTKKSRISWHLKLLSGRKN